MTPSRPAEFRGVVALLVLDLLLGLWLATMRPDWFGAYAGHLPALGLLAVAWGFLTNDSKDRWSAWITHQLQRKTFAWVFGGVAAVGVVFSMLGSTVTVEAVDSGVSTRVRLVRGSQLTPDSAALAGADSSHLNRLTSPRHFWQWTLPVYGRSVWAYTDTHVSAQDVRVRPWRRRLLQYPADFEPMVTVAVLPGPGFFPLLVGDREVRLTLVAADEPRDTLAEITVDSTQVHLLSFAAPTEPDDGVRVRWRSWIERRDTVPANVKVLMDRWASSTRANLRRPLRLGERITWEVRVPESDDRYSGELRLDHVVSDLVLTR